MTAPADDPNGPTREGLWKEFAQAATCPSVPALVGALVVCGTLLSWSAVAIDPTFFAALPTGTFQRGPADMYGRVTALSHKLDRQQQRDPDAVVFLGGSSTYQALADPAVLADAMTQAAGRPIATHNLCAADMGLPEYTAVVDTVLEEVGGAFVFNVSPRQLILSPGGWNQRSVTSPRLGLESDHLDEEVTALGYEPKDRTGNYFFDHFAFLSSRLLPAVRNWMVGPPPPILYADDEEITPEKRAKQRQTLVGYYRQLRGLMKQHLELNLASLERIIERVQASGARVALLESAWNPELADGLGLGPYRAAVRQLAERRGIPYWNLNRQAKLTELDFRDHIHISNPDARRRYCQALANKVARLLRAHSTQESGS